MNMIITSSSLIFPLVTIPYVSRVLGATGMGAVAFAQSISSYFSLVAVLGVTYYGVKVCAEVRNDRIALSKVVKEILAILLISTVIVYSVYLICMFTVPQFIDQRMLFFEFGFTIWLQAFGMEWFYQALEQYSYITIRSVIFKFIALILMFILVRKQSDYVLYGLTVIFAGCASNILNIIRVRKLIVFSQKQKLEIRRHFKPMVWYTMASIASGMYIQVDIVLLGFLRNNTQIGLYQLVSRIKSVLVTAVNSVGNVMLPRISYYQSHNQAEKTDSLIAKNINFVLVVGLAITALLALCAKPIVLIMGGFGFLGSIPPLSVIGGAVLFSALNIVLGNHLIALNKEKYWALVNIVGLAMAIILNYILIRVLGILGAAISIVTCEGCMFAMRAYLCRNLLSRIKRQLDPIKIIVSTLIGTAACLPLRWINMQMFIGLLVTVTVFCIAYLACLLILREFFVLDMSRQFINKFRK